MIAQATVALLACVVLAAALWHERRPPRPARCVELIRAYTHHADSSGR